MAESIWGDTLPPYETKVRVHDTIRPKIEARAFFTDQRFIEARRPGAFGKFKGHVPGCGGDVWWVQHEDATTAAYASDELQPHDAEAFKPPLGIYPFNLWMDDRLAEIQATIARYEAAAWPVPEKFCLEEIWIRNGKTLMNDMITIYNHRNAK